MSYSPPILLRSWRCGLRVGSRSRTLHTQVRYQRLRECGSLYHWQGPGMFRAVNVSIDTFGLQLSVPTPRLRPLKSLPCSRLAHLIQHRNHALLHPQSMLILFTRPCSNFPRITDPLNPLTPRHIPVNPLTPRIASLLSPITPQRKPLLYPS